MDRVAFSLCIALVACRGPDATPAVAAASTPGLDADADGPPKVVAEADYRGDFAGASVYATFEAHGTIASGTCFYDAYGTLVPLRGGIDERGDVMLEEMGESGPVSTIRLARDASGAWYGTWTSEDETRRGPARLEPLVRRAGEPVFVATRQVHVASTARCRSKWTTSCGTDARVPVVLGLADRAFERKLDERLLALATISPPAGVGASIDYDVPLNERGFVSFEIAARLGDGQSEKAGLSAAVDDDAIASDLTAFVDVPKARGALDALVGGACDGGALAHLHDAVLGERGVRVLVDGCDGGRSQRWRELGFAKLAGALRAETPFDAAWSR